MAARLTYAVGSKKMKGISVREATTDDAELIACLIREAFREVAQRFSLTAENCPKHPSNCEKSWVVSDLARGVHYFIISRQGEPVGCAGLEQQCDGLSFLERLAVLPQHRFQGFGHSLVEHVLSRARATGASRLSAAIIADHAELKHWYDNFISIYHMEMSGTVYEGDKTYHIRTEHALRSMTVGERRKCLRDAGFTSVSVYPSFSSRSEETPPNAERVICVALRPQGGP